MNPRARRLIVTGVLVALVLIVVFATVVRFAQAAPTPPTPSGSPRASGSASAPSSEEGEVVAVSGGGSRTLTVAALVGAGVIALIAAGVVVFAGRRSHTEEPGPQETPIGGPAGPDDESPEDGPDDRGVTAPVAGVVPPVHPTADPGPSERIATAEAAPDRTRRAAAAAESDPEQLLLPGELEEWRAAQRASTEPVDDDPLPPRRAL